MRKMSSNDDDHEGCISNDVAVDDVFDLGVGVRKKRMFFVCVYVCVYDGMITEAKVMVTLKDERTIMMMMMMIVSMNPMHVCVCVSGSDAEQPAICRQINPGCA